MRVSPENILGLYAVVMDEVTRLELSLMNFQMRHQGVPELGGDPVSAPAAPRVGRGSTTARKDPSTVLRLSRLIRKPGYAASALIAAPHRWS
jgi:hypothetical protein